MKIDSNLPESLRYVRKCEQLDNGKFIILCQFKRQSELLFQSSVLYIDKTFKRTKACDEIEFNSFDMAQQRTTTLARVYTNMNSASAYEHVFQLVFDQASQDVGEKICFAPLLPRRHAGPAIKAILVDMDGGQAKGLQKYFDNLLDMAALGVQLYLLDCQRLLKFAAFILPEL